MKIGHTVSWIGTGKFFSLEGKLGKVCTGKVLQLTENCGERCVIVIPDHRIQPDAMFPNSLVELKVSDLI